jgi:hypothetical protein
MHNVSNRISTRVAALCLVLAGGVFAAPGMASSSKPEAVPAVAPVTVAVETAEARHEIASAVNAFDATAWTDMTLNGVNGDVFALALRAAEAAVARGDAPATTLTVIDFSRPSTEERLWVFDLRSRELLFRELVSHGRNSGVNMTTSFSNVPESNRSSLGLYRTAEGYIGKHGYSLRLDGLERGVNDRARERAIVIHGAEYVNAATARAQGRLGRSLGCPAVRPEVSRQLIDAVKGGGLVFAYYPDPQWLSSSVYLN